MLAPMEPLQVTQLGPRFRAFAKARGITALQRFGPAVPTALGVREVLGLVRAYYDAKVTRQLHRGGRGIQLGVTLTFAPAPKDVATLWSFRFPSIDEWVTAAEKAARKAGVLGREARAVRAQIDRF